MRIFELLNGITEEWTVDNLPNGLPLEPLVAPEQPAAPQQREAPAMGDAGSEFAMADPNNPMLAAQRMMGRNQPSGREMTSFQPTSLPRPQP